MSLTKLILESVKFELSSDELNRIKTSPSYHQAFNNLEDAENHFNYLMDELYTNLPDQLWLYRVIFIGDMKQLNDEQLGRHWTMNKVNMTDNGFLDNIRDSVETYDGEPYILFGLFPTKYISQLDTIETNMLYPHEEEIWIDYNNTDKFIEAYICNRKDFNLSNPPNSENIRKLK